MECPYCPGKIEIGTQKNLKCPRCGSEIILNEYNHIESAKRFDGERKSTYIIWLVFIILGATAFIFGKGFFRKNFQIVAFFFVGCLFFNFSIHGYKYKEMTIGGIYISKATNPDSFSFILVLVVIISIVGLSLGFIDVYNNFLF